MKQPQQPLAAGKFTTVYGVKGWLKVYSFTEPKENLFSYRPWWIKDAGVWRILEIDAHKYHQQSLVVHVKGLDDRDLARKLCQQEIFIEQSEIPSLGDGDEYYWHQLIGLRVIAQVDGGEKDLGVVVEMMETGANDVLVVAGDDLSIDRRQRLIPYVDQFLIAIDLLAGEMRVDWDPEF